MAPSTDWRIGQDAPMSDKPFKFSLQPALDAAVSEQTQWERTVSDTRAEMTAEQGRLAELAKKSEEISQQILRTSDNLAKVESSPSDFERLAAAAAGLKVLRNRQIRHRESILRQASVLREGHLKLNLQNDNLKQVWSKVKALEKLREKQQQAFDADVERAEQDDIDEAAIQRFQRD